MYQKNLSYHLFLMIRLNLMCQKSLNFRLILKYLKIRLIQMYLNYLMYLMTPKNHLFHYFHLILMFLNYHLNR